jgi:hypothetical protein
MAGAPSPTESATSNPTSGPTISPTVSATGNPTSGPTISATGTSTIAINTSTNTPTMTPSATTTPTQSVPLTVPLLTASHSGTNTTLQWPTNLAATSYTIYRSDGAAGKFVPLSGWTVVDTIAPSAGTTSYVIADEANNTYNTYSYFVVTGTDGSIVTAASNIATRVNFYFNYIAGGLNNYRPSLAYQTDYTQAMDITNELTSAKIERLGKFIPATQAYQLYRYQAGSWIGTNWSNDAGTSASNGFYVKTASSFNWVVAGTDNNPTLSFTANASITSANLRQLPYSCTYQKAQDIVAAIEGSLTTSTNIQRIGLWNSDTQTFQLYRYQAGSWIGANFNVTPGASVIIYVSPGATFNWTPSTVVVN